MSSYGAGSSNGWLLRVINFCCSQYGWPVEYVCEDARLVTLMLLMREKLWTDSGKAGFSLLEQERMDAQKDVPWEELVRRNREELARQMPK